jgi:hypothetical protein
VQLALPIEAAGVKISGCGTRLLFAICSDVPQLVDCATPLSPDWGKKRRRRRRRIKNGVIYLTSKHKRCFGAP